MWVCEQCAAANPAGYARCWRCATAEDHGAVPTVAAVILVVTLVGLLTLARRFTGN